MTYPLPGWVMPPAGGSSAIDSLLGGTPFASGLYSGPNRINVTTGVPVLNRMYGVPFIVSSPVTLTSIACELTAALAGATMRLGVGRLSKADWLTITTLVDAGTVDGSGALGRLDLPINLPLTPDLYVLMGTQQGTGGASFRTVPATSWLPAFFLPTAAPEGAGSSSVFVQSSGQAGAYPGQISGSQSTSGLAPAMWVKAA